MTTGSGTSALGGEERGRGGTETGRTELGGVDCRATDGRASAEGSTDSSARGVTETTGCLAAGGTNGVVCATGSGGITQPIRGNGGSLGCLAVGLTSGATRCGIERTSSLASSLADVIVRDGDIERAACGRATGPAGKTLLTRGNGVPEPTAVADTDTRLVAGAGDDDDWSSQPSSMSSTDTSLVPMVGIAFLDVGRDVSDGYERRSASQK